MTGRAALDPETLLSAYAQGAFPMTDGDGVTRWYTADPRGVLPLHEGFRIHRSLRQTLRRGTFRVGFDEDFEGVMRQCMRRRPDGTWISEELVEAYTRLHREGFAHSVESYDPQTGELVGGLYGVSLGGAFFGESMFHRRTDASKVALVGLVQRLRERGYELLDAQARTAHLQRFGCEEVPASKYLRRLRHALTLACTFGSGGPHDVVEEMNLRQQA
jgi:leucyl/phenylalanyl-tRNA--protein transferase